VELILQLTRAYFTLHCILVEANLMALPPLFIVWTLVVQAGAELSDRDSLLLQARQSEGISARRTSRGAHSPAHSCVLYPPLYTRRSKPNGTAALVHQSCFEQADRTKRGGAVWLLEHREGLRVEEDEEKDVATLPSIVYSSKQT
jgi:hypothetical protein